MPSKRHKPEKIVTKLRRVTMPIGREMARVDAIREVRMRVYESTLEEKRVSSKFVLRWERAPNLPQPPLFTRH